MEAPVVAARLFAGLLLILANGFFVAIEFALTRVRQFPESEFQGSKALERAWNMTDRLEIYLTSCQVGITATSIAVGIVAEPALAAIFEPYIEGTFLASISAGAILAFLIINLVHLTHGEQTPTYLGVERSKWVCKYGATPLYYFAMSIYPIIKLGDGVAKWTLRLFGVELTRSWTEAEEDSVENRADLRRQMASILEAGDLSEERREEVMNALEVGEQPISEVMVDIDEVAMLSTEFSVEENLAVVEANPHTRFPLTGESVSDFRGIVYAPTVVNAYEELSSGEATFEDIAAPPLTFDAGITVSEAIDGLQEEEQELAFVEENGEIVGLLTATDALEEVMGEMRDPTDRKADTDVQATS
ncbi:hypothetical protein AUR64_06385 [Haloprofundus marisrubri]|uniref:CBS domain-containing protein n=1 Tax=Haloprofundus marisrubri TaxID=1514971 RepID=A0A0W1RAX3_9EURY|nr:hemolysin family protein [Haloprofundus marisrubri]KTG10814.1 hypothetical protein AUR64_06385 [Haloprofundus marisrubri]